MWKVAMIALLLVAGCTDEASVSVGVGGHWEAPRPSRPALLEVGVVDSYGVDSEAPRAPLSKLDPYNRGGWFELYWYADSASDYRASVRLSRSRVPGVGESVLVGEFRCGPGRLCDTSGSLHCRYSSDFALGCDFTREDADYYSVSIAGLLDQVPEDAYLEVKICDTRDVYCEAGTLPVELR